MLVVRDIKVRSLSTEYAHILWCVEPTSSTDPITDYSFLILRAGAQSGPYEVISEPLSDVYIWRDNSAKDGRLWGKYFYRIRVKNNDTGDFFDYGSRDPKEVLDGLDPGGVSKEPEPPLLAREMIYRLRLSQKTYSGRECFILQLRTFGTRCPECWNDLHGQRTKSRCKLCFGASFIGGVHVPVQIPLQVLQNDTVSLGLGHTGLIEPGQKIFLAANYPEFKSRDIIVEAHNDRWRVNVINPSKVQGALVSQQLVCSRIPKTDIEYDIPIRGIDPIRFNATDLRHYVGATNVETLVNAANKFHPREP